MRIRTLGRSGLKVTEVCIGTMTFGNQADERTSHAILDRALDAGANFIDASDIYPIPPSIETVGRTEEILGRWLRDKRDSLVVATKCRGRTGPGPNDEGLSRRHILDAVDGSLRRLQTDYIDLYQPHWPDIETPLEETLSALDDLVRWGKLRYIGCSNFEARRLCKALGISDRFGLVRFQSSQNRYNLIERGIEADIVPLCLEESLGIMAYNPLAAGFLTGKYERGLEPPEGTRFTLPGPTQGLKARYWQDEIWDAVDTLKRIAAGLSASPAQVAVAWLLRRPGVTSAILGATKPEQLEESLKGADLALDSAVIEELDAIVPAGTMQRA
jgi:aryl-alcohol dehydrogenase-like predicted oxidoreductase